MSKSEVERFRSLMKEWGDGQPGSTEALLNFLAVYHQSLVNALLFYAADKK